MPAAVSRGDAKILIIGAVVLALLIAGFALFAPQEDSSIRYPSSYSPASAGGKAAYLFLKESGYDIERWHLPPSELPGLVDTAGNAHAAMLVLADPFEGATQREKDDLDSWVRSGGSVLLTGMQASQFLPNHSFENAEGFDFKPKKFKAANPSPLNRGIKDITLAPLVFWNKDSSTPPVFGDDSQAVVVEFNQGHGHIIWWASATPLTNAGLKESGNMELLLNSVGPSGRTRILWDEYFHGERRSLMSYVAATPLIWGLAQSGLLMLAIFATYSRRSGPIRALAPEQRLSPLEFVDGLGGLYQRAHAAAAAVQVAYNRFRYLLTKRLGLANTAPLKDLNLAVRERLGWKEPGLVETLVRCERAIRNDDLEDDAAVQLVQALQQYTRVLRLSTSSHTKEPKGWKQ